MAMAMRSAITTHGFATPRDEFNAAAPVPSQPQISLGELAVDALQQLYALAAMQYEWRQFANAAATYERALAIDIGNADAWDSLGLCMRELKDLDGAISCYRNALRFRPNHAHALSHLGIALREKGFPLEAIACLDQALQYHPGIATAHYHLGVLVKEQQPHNLHIAVRHLFEAVRLDPYYADAYMTLGGSYREAGLFNEAIRMFLQACTLSPENADGHAQLASTYKDTGRINEAITSFKQALQLRPSSHDALCNLVHTLIFVADWREYESNIQALELSLDQQLAEGKLPAVQPFHAFVYPIHLKKIKLLACAYAKRAEQVAAALLQYKRPIDLNGGQMMPPFTHPVRDISLGRRSSSNNGTASTSQAGASNQGGGGGGRLKVGYVSSDFINHPLAHLMQSTFGYHDKSRFEIYCYSLRPSDGSIYRQTIERGAEHFYEVSHLDVVSIASKIASDGIHVLINLNGYTKGARNEIFALRPAAVQMLYMGFPGTMGADFLDYLVTDPIVSPPHLEWTYHEKLIRMPHSYFVCDHRQSFNGPHCGIVPPDAISEHWVAAGGSSVSGSTISGGEGQISSITGSVPTHHQPHPDHPPLASYEWYVSTGRSHLLGVREALRSRYGLPPFATLFCCFNQLYKLDPPTFKSWCSILRAVPNSVLWLLRFPAFAVEHINSALAAEGLPQERIVWMDVAEKAPYIARGSLADLFLDTPMCNGHTTGTDILWSGVPLLTCPLESMCSRVAASLAHAIECEEMVVPDMETYVTTAIKWGNQRSELLGLRRKLWGKRLTTPLFDTRLWVREWEECLVAAWVHYCEGKPPDHIDMAAIEDEEVLMEVSRLNEDEQVIRLQQQQLLVSQQQQQAQAAQQQAQQKQQYQAQQMQQQYQFLAGLRPPDGMNSSVSGNPTAAAAAAAPQQPQQIVAPIAAAAHQLPPGLHAAPPQPPPPPPAVPAVPFMPAAAAAGWVQPAPGAAAANAPATLFQAAQQIVANVADPVVANAAAAAAAAGLMPVNAAAAIMAGQGGVVSAASHLVQVPGQGQQGYHFGADYRLPAPVAGMIAVNGPLGASAMGLRPNYTNGFHIPHAAPHVAGTNLVQQRPPQLPQPPINLQVPPQQQQQMVQQQQAGGYPPHHIQGAQQQQQASLQHQAAQMQLMHQPHQPQQLPFAAAPPPPPQPPLQQVWWGTGSGQQQQPSTYPQQM